MGAFFYRGGYVVPTVATAARTRHVVARHAVSLTEYTGTGLAILVHGRVRVVTPQEQEFAAFEYMHRALSRRSVREWGDGVFLVVAAEQLYTYARHPDQFGTEEGPQP